MNKKEIMKSFKYPSISERKALILNKMKAIGLEAGSSIPNKKYYNK